MKCLLTLGLILAMCISAHAALHTEFVQYQHGNTMLEGYLAYDDTVVGKRPGVLLVHEWWGLNSYIMKRAEKLAKLGFIAFAIDMYGKGKRTTDPEEAGVLAGIYKADRNLMRSRAAAGLQVLIKQKQTDARRVAAIGYCFGGTTVLELARSGADIAGVVSFHGTLDTPDPSDAKNIKGSVLVLHGADDPFVPAAQITAFQDEMRQANVDWQMIFYGGAVHSFTNPESGNDKTKGVAYDERADRRSWEAMRLFFREIFK
ncbi:MAG: dienelactone hydrolase family protein [Dissulfurispiraceae bacterium]